MKLLFGKSLQKISGGRSGYESNAEFWSLIGACTVAANTALIPAAFGQYFAVRMAAIGAGSVVGYVFGATSYALTDYIKSNLSYYLSPAEKAVN